VKRALGRDPDPVRIITGERGPRAEMEERKWVKLTKASGCQGE
jgi:hypothetical protein